MSKLIESVSLNKTNGGLVRSDEITSQTIVVNRNGNISQILGSVKGIAENYNYKISDQDTTEFMNNVSQLGIENIQDENKDVLDGSLWKCTVNFSDGTTYEIKGVLEYPEKIQKIRDMMLELVEYQTQFEMF